MICVFAECNRLPFDLPEAEQELVGGYHTEYSNSMKLGLMLLSEYAHMITTSFIMSIVFWGGTHLPFFSIDTGSVIGNAALGTAVLLGKMSCFLLLFLLVRWTIPRFKFDQLIDLAWKVLIPLTLAILLGVILLKSLVPGMWILLPISEILLLIGFAAVSVATAAKQVSRPRVRKIRDHSRLPISV
jgi:NADH-quinone oxidoreductase subunit H